MEVGFASLHACGRQEEGSSHTIGHGDPPFPEEQEFWEHPRRDEAYSHPQIPRAGDGWTMGVSLQVEQCTH